MRELLLIIGGFVGHIYTFVAGDKWDVAFCFILPGYGIGYPVVQGIKTLFQIIAG